MVLIIRHTFACISKQSDQTAWICRLTCAFIGIQHLGIRPIHVCMFIAGIWQKYFFLVMCPHGFLVCTASSDGWLCYDIADQSV